MIELAEYTEKVKKYVRKDTLREAADALEALEIEHLVEVDSEGNINSLQKWWIDKMKKLGVDAILNLENNK